MNGLAAKVPGLDFQPGFRSKLTTVALTAAPAGNPAPSTKPAAGNRAVAAAAAVVVAGVAAAAGAVAVVAANGLLSPFTSAAAQAPSVLLSKAQAQDMLDGLITAGSSQFSVEQLESLSNVGADSLMQARPQYSLNCPHCPLNCPHYSFDCPHCPLYCLHFSPTEPHLARAATFSYFLCYSLD